MAGTIEGGKRAAETNKQKYGADFYIKMGAKGGSAPKSRPAGFAYMKVMGQMDKLRAAGSKGGTISRRTAKW